MTFSKLVYSYVAEIKDIITKRKAIQNNQVLPSRAGGGCHKTDPAWKQVHRTLHQTQKAR